MNEQHQGQFCSTSSLRKQQSCVFYDVPCRESSAQCSATIAFLRSLRSSRGKRNLKRESYFYHYAAGAPVCCECGFYTRGHEFQFPATVAKSGSPPLATPYVRNAWDLRNISATFADIRWDCCLGLHKCAQSPAATQRE